MRRKLDDRISLAPLEAAIIAEARRLRERLEGRTQGRPTDRIQLAADEKGSVLPDAELQPAFLDRDPLVAGHTFGIERMTQAHAVVP